MEYLYINCKKLHFLNVKIKKIRPKNTEENKMLHFNRIILGATATGLGAFFSEPNHSLLIEPTSMIGPDFSSSFYPGSAKNNTLTENNNHPLFQEAVKIGVLRDGLIHLPGLHTLIYKYLSPYAHNCLLLTDYISSEQVDDKIAVTVFNRNGTTVFTCDELIDATPTMITNQIKTEVINESLGSVFVATKEDAVIPKLPKCELIQTCFPNEFYLHLPSTINSAWGKARSDLIAFISEHKTELEGWILAATAIEKNVKISTNYRGLASVLIPSQFDGIVEGFIAGINFFENRKALV